MEGRWEEEFRATQRISCYRMGFLPEAAGHWGQTASSPLQLHSPDHQRKTLALGLPGASSGKHWLVEIFQKGQGPEDIQISSTLDLAGSSL